MKNILLFLILLGVFLCNGCSGKGRYLLNRSRDAGDIVTIAGGVGAGIKGRIGPINLGLVSHREFAGWRGGSYFLSPRFGWEEMVWPMENISGDVQALYKGVEAFHSMNPIQEQRNKTFERINFVVPVTMYYRCEGRLQPAYPAYYYWQIDLVLGAGPSLRLGINPGEFVDFLAGWAGYDLFDDDLKSTVQSQASTPVPSCGP